MAEPQPDPPLSLLAGAALFLDFDGTLIELADTPDSIRVPPALPDLLRDLERRLSGRLALVSGRALADLDRHVGLSGIAAAGSHGLELRLPGKAALAPDPPPKLAAARAAVAAYADSRPGLLAEEKPAGIALHYRLAPDEGEAARAFAADVAGRTGLDLLHGKMVAELRPPGTDKGGVLRALMAEPPFAGARPVFVGDDLTDEDAFRAAAALGGAGVLVGPPRDSAALWRLDGVEAAMRWLRAAADSKEKRGG
jgi:trehalose 6-phosphate phosphatase